MISFVFSSCIINEFQHRIQNCLELLTVSFDTYRHQLEDVIFDTPILPVDDMFGES